MRVPATAAAVRVAVAGRFGPQPHLHVSVISKQDVFQSVVVRGPNNITNSQQPSSLPCAQLAERAQNLQQLLASKNSNQQQTLLFAAVASINAGRGWFTNFTYYSG